MYRRELFQGELTESEQRVVTEGFLHHSELQQAPVFTKKRLAWKLRNGHGVLVGVLTGDLLWDWLYVDELWVHDDLRGKGLGRELMEEAFQWAASHNLVGIWLWTQSWQAAAFYLHLGYEEFTRFPDFPRGHERIGFRRFVQSRIQA